MTFELEKHRATEHPAAPLTSYLREIVYGGSDGIVTTFAIVAGFAGAQANPATSGIPIFSVLLFGLANLLADGLSMGLGNFLSIRADQDVYYNEKQKEAHEIRTNPQAEFEETKAILKIKKFTDQDATTLATIYKKNPEYWTEFMMKYELGLPNPEKENPLHKGTATFFSFISFGAIPLMPFFLGLTNNIFALSILFTAIALLLLGYLRASVSRQLVIKSIAETVAIGGISALVAYVVGTFFRT